MTNELVITNIYKKRDIYNDVSRFHKIMIRFCDKLVKMVIVKITFK